MNLHAILAAGEATGAASTAAAAAGTATGTVAQEATAGQSALLMLVQFGPIVLIIVLMYFIMIRPQRKKQKEEQKMRNNMRVGDEITTIGGICGRVVNIKEDSLVIETGADRNKMSIKKWAVQTVDTIHDPNDTVDDDDDDDDI